MLCKGSAFMLGGQEMCWFKLVLLLSVTKSTQNFSHTLRSWEYPVHPKRSYSWIIVVHKKSGTALLLFRYTGSGIAFHPNKQHRSPRRYVRTHTHPQSVYRDRYTYPEDIKMLQCLGWLRIYQIRVAKNKALMTPLLCLERLLRGRKADIIPPTYPSVNHFGCKITIIFANMQIFIRESWMFIVYR